MNYVLRTCTATRVVAADSESASSSNAGGASDSDSTAALPAAISTKFGDVTIDEAPRRVVALGWADAEVALSLGVQPVGAADWLAFGGEGIGPWVTEGYGEAPEILGTMELNYESIAALEPDLILDVRSSGDQERYDTLLAIAPVVGILEGADNWLTDRSTRLEMIGTALGKSADEWGAYKSGDAGFAIGRLFLCLPALRAGAVVMHSSPTLRC
nr:ABC transporter substrate-binding protein [uncultured Corynebacterium sp.]